MEDERKRRKWLLTSAVALLDWGLISAAAVAVTYDEVNSAAIPLAVAAVVVVLATLVAWSELLGGQWKLSATRLRRVRLVSYLAYLMFMGNTLLLLLPLGWRHLAAARPAAFTLFRISSMGLIVLLVLTSVALFRWQASLKELEDHTMSP